MVKRNVPPELRFWKKLAESPTSTDFFRRWLELQCRTLDNVSGGVLVLGEAAGKKFSTAARWPHERQVSGGLARASEQALGESKSVVLRERESGGLSSRCTVAHPIRSASGIHGVLAVDVDDLPEDRVKDLLRSLDWGCAWIRGLLARAASDTTVQPGAAALAHESSAAAAPSGVTSPSDVDDDQSDRRAGAHLRSSLDLLTSIDGEGFAESLESFVQDVARRTGSDRVSLGFIEGKQAKIRVTAAGGDTGDVLRRAIESAMDEALDQEKIVLFPGNGKIQINRAHEELARHQTGAPPPRQVVLFTAAQPPRSCRRYPDPRALRREALR